MASAGGLAAARGAAAARRVALVAAALSLEAFKGSTVPFDERLHALRPQPGQQRRRRAAARAARRQPDRGQPRGLRPRAGPVHAALHPAGLGAVADAARLRDRRAGARARGGHRQPAGLGGRRRRSSPAATSTASRSRCRSTTSRWPSASSPRSPSAGPTRCSRRATPSCRPFLTPRPGLSSGLMIAQYAAAALVNECQVLVASRRARARSRPRPARRTSTRWARSRR